MGDISFRIAIPGPRVGGKRAAAVPVDMIPAEATIGGGETHISRPFRRGFQSENIPSPSRELRIEICVEGKYRGN